MRTIRQATPDDAVELTDVLRFNRAFLAPWEPVRADSYFTVDGQRADLEWAAERRASDLAYPFVILDDDGSIAGRININNVVRGAGQFASLGYWVAESANGRGVGTRAVKEASDYAFDHLNLHRLEAGTLVHNLGSQRVLEKNGFCYYGTAPALIRIAGVWQDHRLYQKLNERWVA